MLQHWHPITLEGQSVTTENIHNRSSRLLQSLFSRTLIFVVVCFFNTLKPASDSRQVFMWNSQWLSKNLCACVRALSYLKASESEPAGLVWQRSNWNDEWAVGDVLVVELDWHLVVTCGKETGYLLSPPHEPAKERRSCWQVQPLRDAPLLNKRTSSLKRSPYLVL